MERTLAAIQLQTLDRPIEAMQAVRRAVKQPTGGWLKAARQVLGLTSATVAKRLGVSRQAYAQTETRESAGTVTIEQLSRAATALDCDLVYFLLPRADAAVSFAGLAARNDPAAIQLRASEHSMMLEGQQVEGDIDGKNIGLAKQIYSLRQNLSLYELITVNASKLKEAGASEALFTHLRGLALEAIALTLSKIYDRETTDLNSIDGVINALAESGYHEAQTRAAERFAARHGIPRSGGNLKAFLRGVLAAFADSNSAALASMRRFRDHYAMRSEHDFAIESLPSFEEFEALYRFAYEFYFLIGDSILGIGPALMTLQVGSGFLRLLKQLGITHPAPGFDASDA